MREDVPVTQQARGTPGISLRGTAIVGAGLAVSQVVAMLQMLVVSRILGPVEFGVFGALAVILLLGSTTMAATQVVIARHVASRRSAEHVGTGAVVAVGAVTTAIVVALAPFISHLLNLSDPIGLGILAATFLPLTITGAQLGLLQGTERHWRLGALYVVAAATRVAGAITGAAVGGSADATVAGLAVGATLGAAGGTLLLAGLPEWTGSAEEGPRDFLVEVGHASHALVALYALTNLDVLLARAMLPAREAGLYAAGALVARAVFFLPQAVLVAAFPRMVAGHDRAQRQALLAVVGLGLAATAVVAAVPTLVVRVMSGADFLGVAAHAWLFALAGAGFGVVQVLLYARMAHHDRRAAILLWSGVLTLAVLGLTLGTSMRALATCSAGVAWLTAALGVAWARSGPTPASHAAEAAGPIPAATPWE